MTRATLTGQVETAIRADIVDGALAPGERLRFADLSKRYGVSATPLREALQRLAAQGLIDWDPRFGATVAELSTSELRDIYWLRDSLESVAIRRSIELGDERWKQRMTEAWNRFDALKRPRRGAAHRDAEAWSLAHRALHESFFAACDSPWLLRFVDTLADHSERYRLLSARTSTRDTHEEHEDIYRCAMSGDVEGGVAALQRHLTATVQAVSRAIEASPLAEPLEPAQVG